MNRRKSKEEGFILWLSVLTTLVFISKCPQAFAITTHTWGTLTTTSTWLSPRCCLVLSSPGADPFMCSKHTPRVCLLCTAVHSCIPYVYRLLQPAFGRAFAPFLRPCRCNTSTRQQHGKLDSKDTQNGSMGSERIMRNSND